MNKMLFVLSIPVITDNMRALAAMRSRTIPDSGHAALAPVDGASKRGLLAVMIRQSFAEVVLGLLPHVSDCTLGAERAVSAPGHTPPEGPDDPDLMSVEIDLPCRLHDAALWSVRRGLEQATGIGALSRLVTAAADPADSAEWLAKAFADEARDALKAVKEAITTPPQDTFKPFVRCGIGHVGENY